MDASNQLCSSDCKSLVGCCQGQNEPGEPGSNGDGILFDGSYLMGATTTRLTFEQFQQLQDAAEERVRCELDEGFMNRAEPGA
jgi:hypothetical protein